MVASTCPRHFRRLFTPGRGSATTLFASPTQPNRLTSTRSVCRQHSYMSVPGITWSSTKWHSMNHSAGWMSYSPRTNPSPNRPPLGSSIVTRSNRRSIPDGRRVGAATRASSKGGPNAPARSPRCSASMSLGVSADLPASTGQRNPAGRLPAMGIVSRRDFTTP